MKKIVLTANAGDPDELVAFAAEAEDAGYDGFFLVDHMNTGEIGQEETLDPWVLLTAIACGTNRIRVGTGVTPISRRRPWQLAKEVIALDHVSHGRVTLGIGLGEIDRIELEPFGDFRDQKTRAAQTDEALVIMDQMLRGLPIDHSGPHYELHAHLKPGAVQSPRPPIWIAATPPFRKGLERAGRWDGLMTNSRAKHDWTRQTPAELRKWAAELLDRPGFDVITRTAPGHTEEEYEEIGVSTIIHLLWPPSPTGMDDFRRAYFD